MLYRFICFIMFAGFLAGCSQPADTQGSADQAATQSSAPAEPDAYYEFLWCEFGDNYTEEARDALWTSLSNAIDVPTSAWEGIKSDHTW